MQYLISIGSLVKSRYRMVQVGVVWTFRTEFGRNSEEHLEGILLPTALENLTKFLFLYYGSKRVEWT